MTWGRDHPGRNVESKNRAEFPSTAVRSPWPEIQPIGRPVGKHQAWDDANEHCTRRRMGLLALAVVMVWNRRPGLVRVEQLHLAEFIESAGPEILLVHDAVVTDNECLHSRHSVFRGRRYQRKASDHHALHHKIHLA